MRRRGHAAAALALLAAAAGPTAGGCAQILGADFSDKTVRVEDIGDPCAACEDGSDDEACRDCQPAAACTGDDPPPLEDCRTPRTDENCDGEAACTGDPRGGWVYGNVYQQLQLNALLEESQMLAPSLVATDSAGAIVLAATVDGQVEYGSGPIPSDEGNSSSNVHVVKIDPATGKATRSESFGDLTPQDVSGLRVDEDDNIVITGSAAGSIDFGDGPLSEDNTRFFYVTKLHDDLSPAWKTAFGRGQGTPSPRLGVGPRGQVVVAGSFTTSLDLGELSLNGDAEGDVFVLSLAEGGAIAWQRRFGGMGKQALAGVAVSGAGDIALAGRNAGELDFAERPLRAAAGTTDGWVAVLDRDGAARWAVPLVGPAQPAAVAIDDAGSVFVLGYFSGTIDVGAGHLLNAVASSDAFVAAYDAQGGYLWSKVLGGQWDQHGFALALDPAPTPSLIIGGDSQGPVDFGSDVAASVEDDLSHAFVAKLDAESGRVFWAQYWRQDISAPGQQLTSGVARDGLGNIVSTGTFTSSIGIAKDQLPSHGAADTWVAVMKP